MVNQGVFGAFMFLWLFTLPDFIYPYANPLGFKINTLGSQKERQSAADTSVSNGCKGLDGRKKYLIADSGLMLAVCKYCGPHVDTAKISVRVHGKYGDTFAMWILEPVGDKCALKSYHSHNYAARCADCWNVNDHTQSVFLHKSKASPEEPETLWFVEKHNQSYAFKSDSGNYMGRCNDCGPKGDYAFVRHDSPVGVALWRVLPV